MPEREAGAMKRLVSPWLDDFDSFARSVRARAIVAAPYITGTALRRFADLLNPGETPQVRLLTNLHPDSLLRGSVDVHAIAQFCRSVPATTVRHLPRLHAKAYVADDHTAIVTSGNLTQNSLEHNYEYGIRISDPPVVRQIAGDLTSYGAIGAEVSVEEMDELAELSGRLRAKHADLENAQAQARQEVEDEMAAIRESLWKLRDKPGDTTNAIFARTILHLLRTRTLTTDEMHPIIQSLHPDLCDDGVDRMIGRISFGKKWKHHVRNAQQHLKRRGQITLVDGRWQLVRPE